MGTRKLFQFLTSKRTALHYSTSSKKIDLSGVFPPIVTPFNADQSIAWDKLESNIGKLNSEPLAGYLVHGSNGEFIYLSPEEKLDVVKAMRQSCGPGKLLLAGSGCESSLETIRMTEAMASAGCDAVVVITPCYYKGGMTAAALEAHYTEVADASPVPVVLYSVPANTSLDLPLSSVVRLASHPNIIGIKDSGGDITKLASMVHLTRDQEFQVIAGSASFLLAALTVGSVGGICALANVLPRPVCDLVSLHRDNKELEAKRLQHLLIGPNTAVTRQFGVPGLKLAMDWSGYYGGPTRRPLLPLSAEQASELRGIFKASGYEI